MKKLISMITAISLTVGLCAMSLYAYSYKTVLADLGQSLHQRFTENVTVEKQTATFAALSNFFIARPRAYLRQRSAFSSSPDALATAGQMTAANMQAEPITIDRVPITARIQIVYMPNRISMSFAKEATGEAGRQQIASAQRINDS